MRVVLREAPDPLPSVSLWPRFLLPEGQSRQRKAKAFGFTTSELPGNTAPGTWISLAWSEGRVAHDSPRRGRSPGHARPSDPHAVARDSSAAATQVPPSRVMAGRAAPREEFGSSGWGPTGAPALLTAEVGPRGAPASPTPNSASPLGIGRAQIPGPLPCSSELASGSSDLRPLYRCDSPIPLPQWTSVGGG